MFAEIISLGGLFSDLEWGYVLAFAFFIVMMFIRPAGLLGEAPMMGQERLAAWGSGAGGAGRAALRLSAIPITCTSWC